MYLLQQRGIATSKLRDFTKNPNDKLNNTYLVNQESILASKMSTYNKYIGI